jgi:16S rRNA (cytosine1402-N4)-methyltransferase
VVGQTVVRQVADSEEVTRQNAPQGAGHGRVHVPVLLQEAIDFLAVKRGGMYIDATVGLAGHSCEIAKLLGAPGHLIGFDKDPAALERAPVNLQPPRGSEGDWPKVELIHASFSEIGERFAAGSIDGLLADVGVSSLQLNDPERGFSFQAEGPLDMRMNPASESTAEQVVNHMGEKELADVIYEFGEERRSRRIARAIVRARPIRSTAHLAEVVSVAARTMKSHGIHPATLTFQGIRIFVNRELDDLRELLSAAPKLLKPGGRVVVISFHSLEDRIVKDALRDGSKAGVYEVLTKKPVTATNAEVYRNPRSRSAKLRAAERI